MDPSKSSSLVVWLVGVAFAAACIAVAMWLGSQSHDPLCLPVQEAGFECTGVPIAHAKPGALLNREMQSVGDVTDSACLLRGADSVRLAEDTRGVSVAWHDVQLPIVAGRALPFPDGKRPDVRADWDRARRLDLQIGRARQVEVDAQQLKAHLTGCSVLPACTDRVRSGDVKLVQRVLLVDDLRYRLLDEGGAQVPMTLPRSDDLMAVGDQQLGTTVPLAIGIAYFDPQQLDGVVPCESAVAFHAVGQSQVNIYGARGRGAISPQRTDGELGKMALLSASGSEVSDCDKPAEASRAYGQAFVDQPEPHKLRFAGDARATSGRYHAGRCRGPGGKAYTGLLTTDAFARLDMQGQLEVLLRTPGAKQISVNWDGMPLDSHLTLLASDGGTLFDERISAAEGSQTFDVVGPGVFRLKAKTQMAVQRQGENSSVSKNFEGSVSAEVVTPKR